MITLEVTGMTCGGCASAVERIIKAPTVRRRQIDLASGRVEAEAAPAGWSARSRRRGYTAKAI